MRERARTKVRLQAYAAQVREKDVGNMRMLQYERNEGDKSFGAMHSPAPALLGYLIRPIWPSLAIIGKMWRPHMAHPSTALHLQVLSLMLGLSARSFCYGRLDAYSV